MSERPPLPAADPAAIFAPLGSRMELVEAALREQLPSESALVGMLGDHVLSAGGKRLRPALVLLTAEMCGYTGPRSVQIAAAIELLHTATLVHDDVVDVADVRRGRPSANAIWNNRRAVLAGDFFYARASTMICEDGSLDVVRAFADTVKALAEGELLQLERSFDPSVTEAGYYGVIERKSAKLLSTACETGSILAGVTHTERRHVAELGREVGLAFQLRDDALDYEAAQAELGKAPLTDLHEGKVTMPLLLVLKRCGGNEREQIVRVLKESAQAAAAEALGIEPVARPEEIDHASVVALVERYRGVEDTVRRAHEHVARACDAIAAFPKGPAKTALLTAARYAVTRDR